MVSALCECVETANLAWLARPRAAARSAACREPARCVVSAVLLRKQQGTDPQERGLGKLLLKLGESAFRRGQHPPGGIGLLVD
jgi:hypothetical protein